MNYYTYWLMKMITPDVYFCGTCRRFEFWKIHTHDDCVKNMLEDVDTITFRDPWAGRDLCERTGCL